MTSLIDISRCICFYIAGTVLTEMRRVFEIPEAREVQLLSNYLPGQYDPLTKLESTLEDAGIGYGHVLIVEEKGANSSWPRQGRSGSHARPEGLYNSVVWSHVHYEYEGL